MDKVSDVGVDAVKIVLLLVFWAFGVLVDHLVDVILFSEGLDEAVEGFLPLAVLGEDVGLGDLDVAFDFAQIGDIGLGLVFYGVGID